MTARADAAYLQIYLELLPRITCRMTLSRYSSTRSSRIKLAQRRLGYSRESAVFEVELCVVAVVLCPALALTARGEGRLVVEHEVRRSSVEG